MLIRLVNWSFNRVQVAQQVHLAQLVRKVLQGCKVPQVQLVLQAPKEPQAPKELRALKEPQVLRVQQVPLALKET